MTWQRYNTTNRVHIIMQKIEIELLMIVQKIMSEGLIFQARKLCYCVCQYPPDPGGICCCGAMPGLGTFIMPGAIFIPLMPGGCFSWMPTILYYILYKRERKNKHKRLKKSAKRRGGGGPTCSLSIITILLSYII